MMELIKDNWQNSDIDELLKHLETYKRSTEKCLWEKNIIRTNFDCLAILSKDIQHITGQILKGNYMTFVSLQRYDNYPLVTILGHLICKIKDFDTMKKYLDMYSEKVDNWANCDQLKFKINKDNESNFWQLINEYIVSPLTYRRRIALIILFNFINNPNIDRVLSICNSLYNEKEYYVNMANAWLLCECFIKQKDKTLSFITGKHKINSFTLNKTISKCCDSYRVSIEDKTTLKKYRV